MFAILQLARPPKPCAKEGLEPARQQAGIYGLNFCITTD